MQFHFERWTPKLNSTEGNDKWRTTVSFVVSLSEILKDSINASLTNSLWIWISCVGIGWLSTFLPQIDYAIQSINSFDEIWNICKTNWLLVSVFGEHLWRSRFGLGNAPIHYSLWGELQILIRIHNLLTFGHLAPSCNVWTNFDELTVDLISTFRPGSPLQTAVWW